MGRYGAAILTIVGTVVGAYFGYPALGAFLGGLAGQLLFPAQLPNVQGPRLADLGQTASNVGASIQEGWGTYAVSGCVIAKTDIQEIIESEELGGKGGSSQTVETPTYYQTFAIGIGQGPIGGVRTIWANGKAIYDRRPRKADETDAEFTLRMAASTELEGRMTVYLGTDDQEPDPTLEAFYGVGEISGFQELAYIVFENWQNKDEDGRRMPAQWKIEVYDEAIIDTSENTEYSNEVLYKWLAGSDPINSKNKHLIGPAYSGYASVIGGVEYLSAGPFESIAEAIATREAAVGKSLRNYLGHSTLTVTPPNGDLDGYTDLMGAPTAYATDAVTLHLQYNHFSAELYSVLHPTGLLQTISDAGLFELSEKNISINTPPSSGFGGDGAIYQRSHFLNPTGDVDSFAAGWDFVIGDFTPTYYIAGTVNMTIVIKRIPQQPKNPCIEQLAKTIPGIAGFVVLAGQLKACGNWSLQSGTWRVLAKYTEGSGQNGNSVVVQYPLNPIRPLGHAEYDDEAFWTDAHELAVAKGEMPSGTYGVDYPVQQTFGYSRSLTFQTIETREANVAEIVRDLCLAAGYSEDQVDVTDLEELTVMGYVRTRVMPARAAIDPLRQACFFDGVESDPAIKFVRRGKGIVATLVDTTEQSDLGAHISGEQIPSRITTKKILDTDLPRTVRVHYLSQSRDYESGEQPSPVRIETAATNDQDLELPIVLTDEQAARIASALWADAWASRWMHEAQIDGRYLDLEPTDCLGIPVDGEVQRCRIVSITDVLPSVRKLALIRDDDGAFISYAVASTPPTTSTTPSPTLAGPAEALLLDIPLLREVDDDGGFYVAMRAYLTGGFQGAALYRSVDGGSNYSRVAQFASEATIGTLINAVPAGLTSTWDQESEILVELSGGTLESRTEGAVLDGANAAAIGADGRWEIVQFRDAELLAGKVYRLTVLLRGRRGTEHIVGNSEADDRFVLLTGPGIQRVTLATSQIGREYLYKAVASGMTLDGADSLSFTGRGMALKPFSPAMVAGEQGTDSTWTITWVRRGRIGQTLQSGIDVPLSEDEEDYEVDIFNGSAVVRTLSVSTESATYTAAQQITDFGSVQATLTIEVFQMSAQIGRGTGTEATL